VSEFPRPRLVVSKCIEFDHCRWNGLMIASDVVKLMKPHVEFLPVCPEVEIGLGVPRDPIRIITRGSERRLYQPATGEDWTEAMQQLAASHLSSLTNIDGFILKGRSPSCGIKDVKVYHAGGKGTASGKGTGFFAAEVLNRFGHLAVEEEGRLTNYTLRDHFLTRIFASARLRAAKATGSMKELVRFHTGHKLLLMAYSQQRLSEMGRVVANHDRKPLPEVWSAYEALLGAALREPAGARPSINVLQHALGYFKTGLSSAEKKYFLDTVSAYRAGRVPLSACVSVLRAWVARFDERYLSTQVFFKPYPEDLVQITDSGKGRNL
jgi:uncharacterized protein YbgA (DUF1722 family)/uncharacterized protein YbbK (DUF523 family)